jgi:steroid delta-isomerase-like uncharacterized protein
MAANTSRALVSRYLDLYNTGNVVIADEIIAADFVDHTHPELRRGPEDVKHMVTGFRAAFPDALGMVEQVISEGDMVAFRFVLRGTHQGTFGHLAPTGKQVAWTGMDFVRIADGKFAELWSNQDTLSLLQQLGGILR